MPSLTSPEPHFEHLDLATRHHVNQLFLDAKNKRVLRGYGLDSIDIEQLEWVDRYQSRGVPGGIRSRLATMIEDGGIVLFQGIPGKGVDRVLLTPAKPKGATFGLTLMVSW